MSGEQWRPIPGYEGYEVSDQGRVRSLTRMVPRGNGGQYTVRERVLRPWPDHKGYPCVNLGAGNPRRVHRLVMEAFVHALPSGQQVRHRDGDRTNPALSNLTYGTQSQNELDKRAHGTQHNLNKTHCPQRHRYDDLNTRYYQGRRYCRACQQDRQRARDSGA